MPPLNHPAIFACLGMVVGLYGIIYFEVARVPERAWLLAAVNRSLNFQTRGLGVGLWMTAYFLATLLAPLALVAIGAVAGGLKPAMLVFAAAMAALTATVPFLRVEGEM